MFGINLTRRRLAVTGGAMLASAIGGGVAGYLVAVKRLEEKYASISEKEIEEAKDYYIRFYDKEYPTPQEAVEALIGVGEATDEKTESVLVGEAARALHDYRGESDAAREVNEELAAQSGEVPPATTVVVNNIFQNPPEVDTTEEWDYEAEVRNRTEEAPYIITDEEFFQNEKEYEQFNLTYFEGDDVVADQADVPMENSDKILGESNLRFGYGSKDHNTVYVRNDSLEAEYEIVRSTGKYSEEVAGFIEHSGRPKIRKFRHGDDEQ